MAEFIGIRNENEFYFAHYLSSLMDDELKEICSSDEMKAACDRLYKLQQEYHDLQEARELVKRRRPAAYAQDREDYFKRLRDFHKKLADILGYAADWTSPGTRLFPGAKLTVPVSGILAGKDGSVQAVLIESSYDYASGVRFSTEGILENFLTSEQTAVEGLPEVSRQVLSDRVCLGKSKSEKPTWENLLSTEIFASETSPRFIVVFGEDSILLADQKKWPEKRTLIFDLDEIYSRGERATFRAMASLLSKTALAPDGATPLPDRLDENSHKNAFGVSKSLRYAMREAIELLGNAILSSHREGNGKDSGVDAHDVSSAALSKECIIVMYRFLFVLFLESRKDLGYFETTQDVNDMFWSAYGFDHLRDLETVPLLTDADKNGHYFDRSIKQLFAKIWNGCGRTGPATQDSYAGGVDAFRILPLKAHLFDPERTPLFNASEIPNEVWQRIIYSLSIGEAGTGRRKRKGRISYAQLGIQQLGAVYEALLSYTGFNAKTDLYEVAAAGSDIFDTGYFVTAEDLKDYTNDEKVANPDGTLVCHKQGSFIYRMAGRDRERSASYYTPEVLTRCLVRLALKERISDEMPADEVMKLTVCEPAMGSAAFLNEAIDQLADIYLKKKQKELKRTIPVEKYAAEKARVKMVIADNNVFGVDLNPTAADLAEVSLWLGSIGGERLPTGQDRDEPYIPWFGTQLKCGNSIIGCRREVVFRDGTRKDVGFGEEFPKNAVWHFLIPDEGMAINLDAVVKGIVGDEVAQRLKKWKKAFALPDKKRQYENYDRTWKRLSTLSEAIDKIWRSAAEDIASLDERTRDDVAYFGHEPKTNAISDLKTKDRQLWTELSRDEYGNIDYTKSLGSVSDYFRLKTILDLWCSLWFWPLDKTERLPTWADFEAAVRVLTRSDFDEKEQMELDLGIGELRLTTAGTELEKEFKRNPTLGNLYKLFPFIETSEAIAERHHFLHWELEFSPVFKNRGGFDLIIGNPPWVKPDWEEAGLLSEYDPHIAIRKISASDTVKLREGVFRKVSAAKDSYLCEFTDTTGTKAFLNAKCNYPSLVGVRTNLYKFFLPLAFRIANDEGVSAYIHPEGVYDDPAGGKLRVAIYPRLRLRAQFINELKLFDIDHHVIYGLNIYGAKQDEAGFRSVAKLYHPNALDECLKSGETSAPLPLERNEQGTWNVAGHPDRVVKVNDDTLALFASLYDEPGTPPRQARLPALYTERFLSPILERFAHAHRLMKDVSYGVSDCWNETISQKDGTIKRQTGFASEAKEVIYTGPQFFVGNPINKTARPVCRLNSDYDNVDLTEMSEDYRPRTNYGRNVDWTEYNKRMPEYNGKKICDHFRLICRNFVSPASERTLIPIFIPKGYAHVHSLIEWIFDERMDMSELTSIFGAWMSLPFDWFIRSTGRNHIFDETTRLLPCIGKSPLVSSRALLLNCLNRDYVELWHEAWDDTYWADGWLSSDACLTKWADHLAAGNEWKWETPLRTQLDRRQALVELDVIVTKALGLSLDDLLLMYRVSFPVLRKYEADTYYDQNGRCVFSAKSGESYLSRQEWESIKDMKEGEFKKTITETVFSDTPTERTITYKAPFFKKCREDDYKEAWEMLEKRG
jgi:hypothetical protein